MFYVQHQFEETYWQDNGKWDYFKAGIKGSSYYALPKVLQWLTANIGIHHLHHLDHLIPNYRLQERIPCLGMDTDRFEITVRLPLQTISGDLRLRGSIILPVDDPNLVLVYANMGRFFVARPIQVGVW